MTALPSVPGGGASLVATAAADPGRERDPQAVCCGTQRWWGGQLSLGPLTFWYHRTEWTNRTMELGVEDLKGFSEPSRYPLSGQVLEEKWSVSHSVMLDALWPHGLYVARQAPPSIGFSRQEYWRGCHSLLQGICPIQRLNLGLLHCRQILYCLSHQGSHL